ncbi:hypothetical protein HPN57_02965 [Klebsiella pneumoniae]|nr:hypothetical protein [Klebsiella pneumoniae]MBD7757069.1 hypothetical protein [Klebsiella pneumoniae]MBD7772252.1 hypothetical protein [Klebsiella pneumoniae]
MTDITELAQLRAELLSPAIGSNAHLRKIALSLVEALEKAQAQSSKWLEAYHKAVSIGARYEERIAELESRTVKMPEPFKLAKSSSGLTYYYADEVNEALSAAGIKWEGE